MKRHVLCLSSAIAFALPATASAASPQEDLQTYATSRYGFCDAKILARLWHQTIREAKLHVGRKLRMHEDRIVDIALADARREAANDPSRRCTYDQAGYGFSDVEKLAKIWQLSNLETKARIEQKVAQGLDANVTALLGGAKSGSAQPAASRPAGASSGGIDALGAAQRRDWNAFMGSSYSYCDAKVLAAYWGTSIDEAKMRIGRKSSAGDSALPTMLRDAQKATEKDASKRCTFGETAVSYGDAQTLASYWQKPLTETKARIAEKVSAGKYAEITAALEAARKP